jgi:hypothetical protein
MRAWLEMLQERHPDVTWIAAEQSAQEMPSEEKAFSAPTEFARSA